MTADAARDVKSIFGHALTIDDAGDRAAYLAAACGGDPELRGEVERLIAAHGAAGEFMRRPAADATGGYEPRAEGPGTMVGPYKLLQEIGEGGMGTVFMAEQEQPVRRMVALKIIRDGMDSRAVLARFEAERQALAMMDHPNIAKVLDAGTTASGRPFFVMELVKGVPITKYCDEHQLTLRERLSLFVPVCQAIQHAHQKGVIHRDVKPSNVLVAQYDDKPVPKVIDFGVAKAASQKLTDKTLFTAFGSVVGTLEYMSPEQAKLNQLDVDTRSDVYSLGVLLYELLTGSTPLERARLKTAALDEVLRLIREEEPPRPSTRLSTAATLPKIAASRRDEPGHLGKSLRGELDWIVMKALEKDRTRRYETANGLARDVERYLRDETVEACPPTWGYRLKKAYRKNRAVVGVVAGFLLLVAGAGAMGTALAVQARRAERAAAEERDRAQAHADEANKQRAQADRERQRAEEEKRSAEAVRNFLQDDLLRQADVRKQADSMPLAGGEFEIKENPTVNELLDRAAAELTPERIEKRFPGMPFVQAEVLHAVANAYVGIYKHEKARPLVDRARALYEASRGADDPATLLARQSQAYAYVGGNGIDPRAESLLTSFVADGTRVLGPKDRRVFDARIWLGVARILNNRAKEAIAHFRELKAEGREYYGATDLLTLLAAGELAMAYRYDKQTTLALAEIEAIRDTMKGMAVRPDHPLLEAGLVELALTYDAAWQKQKAVEVYQEILDAWKARGQPFHVNSWRARHLQAWVYARNGNPEKAAELFEANVAAAPSPANAFLSLNALGQTEEKLGRDDKALVARARQALATAIGSNGPQYRSWITGWGRIQLGRYLVRVKEYAEAEAVITSGLREMIDEYDQVRDYALVAIPDGMRALRELYQQTNRQDEAARVIAEIWDNVNRVSDRAAQVKTWPRRHTLAWEFFGSGDVELAGRLFAQNVRAAGSPVEKSRSLHGLHTVELKLGKVDDALKHAREALDVLVRANGPAHRDFWTGKMRANVGSVLLVQKKYAEAEPYLVEGCREIADHIQQVPAYEYPHMPGQFEQLARLYQRTNRPEKAKEWLAFKQNTFEKMIRDKLRSAGKLTPADVAIGKAVILDHVDAGRADEAFALFRELEPRIPATNRTVMSEWMALSLKVLDTYKARGEPEQVRPWAALRVPALERELADNQKANRSEPEVLRTASLLAFAYADADRGADVVRLFEETFARQKANGWQFDAVAQQSYATLRTAVAQAGRPDLATDMTTALLAELGKRPETPKALIAREYFSLGHSLSSAKKYADAEPPLRTAVQLQAEAAPNHWNATKYKLWLGTALLNQKKYAEAEPLLLAAHREAVDRLPSAPAWEKQFPAVAAQRLAALYEALDKPDEVAKWQAERAKRTPSRPEAKGKT